jgi:branched-chain amino acid transport system substrate-binding protein
MFQIRPLTHRSCGSRQPGIDILVDMAAPKFAAQVIKKAGELNWKPIHLLGVGSSSVDAV